MSRAYILDASALLTMLQHEPGADRVGQRLGESVISAVNLAEVASVLNKLGMPVEELEELFVRLDLTIVDYDQELAIATGALRSQTAPGGLSLGDRACLATASQTGRIVLTADSAWKDYATTLGLRIENIRN